MRCHCTPVRMAKLKNNDTTKCWRGRRKTGSLMHSCWECKMAQAPWQRVWQFLIIVNTCLSWGLAAALLGIYTRETKLYTNVRESKKLGRTLIPSSVWMVTQTLAHPCNRTPLGGKKEWTADTGNSLGGSQGHCTKWKKSISQEYMLYGSTYITFFK